MKVLKYFASPDGRPDLGAALNVDEVLAAVGALPRLPRRRRVLSETQRREGGGRAVDRGRRRERGDVFALSLPELELGLIEWCVTKETDVVKSHVKTRDSTECISSSYLGFGGAGRSSSSPELSMTQSSSLVSVSTRYAPGDLAAPFRGDDRCCCSLGIPGEVCSG